MQPNEIGPAEDVYEYTIAASDIPFTELGGWCRLIEIVDAGSGSLAVRTKLSGTSVARTLTSLLRGDRLGPAHFTSVAISGTNVVKIRCWR
jgi:hypothetical protein